jgi:acyl-CoA thioester hydrolase
VPADGYRWFDFTVLVRDLDPQAHMANHVYVAYLSEARARWLRALDPDGRLFRPSVVADVHVRYVSSLLARETFRVGVLVTKVGTSSVTFGYRIEAGDGRLVCEADSVEVMVDAQTRRPRALSAEARAALGAA